MAIEGVQTSLIGTDVDADLSTNQFYCVKYSTTDFRVSLATEDGEVIIGILQNNPDAAGETATVCFSGVSKVVAGETLVAGDLWGVDTNGKAKKVDATSTGADNGDFVAGTVMEGAAADEYASVLVGFPQFIVTSA